MMDAHHGRRLFFHFFSVFFFFFDNIQCMYNMYVPVCTVDDGWC